MLRITGGLKIQKKKSRKNLDGALRLPPGSVPVSNRCRMQSLGARRRHVVLNRTHNIYIRRFRSMGNDCLRVIVRLFA